ncbi:MAG: hypothetical protein V3U57_06975 [Robiginitomaculum sp.]
MKNIEIWRLSLPLRVLLGIFVVLDSIEFIKIFGSALIFDDTTLLYGMIDLNISKPLALWQVLLSMLFLGIALIAIWLVFLAVNQFFSISRRNGFFVTGAIKTLRRMGFSLILLWVGMALMETTLPWVLTYKIPPMEHAKISWLPFDTDMITLLIGFVLLLMASALNEGRTIDDENKQII